MLKVKTYIDKSPINGTGLFAAEPIKKDTVIWDIDPMLDRLYTDRHLEEMDEQTQAFVKKYAYKDEGLWILCVDDARFMNHSKSPSTKNGKAKETIASHDIVIGEELTCDYDEIDDAAKDKLRVGEVVISSGS
jgi:SET domain-containing protein